MATAASRCCRLFALMLYASCLVLQPQDLVAQRRQSYGIIRSYSDPGLNRNGTHFHRQSSYNGHRRDNHCSTNYKFDYIQLTLQWAPGTCSTSPQECKREVNDHFTVHGMWPTQRGTQEPANCCFDNTFDYRALEPIMKDLNEYWFSLYEPNNSRGFWSHEWLKHGTCSKNVPSLRGELNYFGKTVDIAKKIPILQTLSKANIVPVNGKAYKSSDIYNALLPLSGGKVIGIECNYEHHQPIPVMTGLNFCFDADFNQADCPETKRKCQRQIIIPASATRIYR